MATEDNDLIDDEVGFDDDQSGNEIEGLGDDAKKKNNVFFFGILCLIVGAVFLFILGSSDEKVVKDLDAQVDEDFVVSKTRDLDMPAPGVAPDQLFPNEGRRRLIREVKPPEPVVAAPPPVDNRAELKAQAEALRALQERRSAQSVIFNGNGGRGGSSAAGDSVSSVNQGLIDSIQNAAGISGGSFGDSDNDSDDGAFSNQLQIEPTTSVEASILKDTTFTLAEGNLLGCVLETAISTDLPGKTRCILSENAYSYDGKSLLLEKGTRVIGEYQGGLNAGVKRIFVIWTRAITPDGIDIVLNSGSTDSIGLSGAGVFVDTHFFERFGASTLLSLFGAVAAGAGDDERLETAGENFNDSAAIALENSINIQPTGYKNQGDKIRIFVARDLDFKNALILKSNQRG